MSKRNKVSKNESGISTKLLWIAGVPLAALGILMGYFIWDISSPVGAGFAFLAAALTGIPLAMAIFRNRRDIAFLAIFAWATMLFFARFLFGGGMLFGTDMMGLGYFAHDFYKNYILEFGSYPLWEPLLHGGMPFHAGMHGDVLYPTRIFELLMPLHYALGFKLVFHVWLAGFFMFGFLRRLKLGRGASLFGGLAYMFGPFFISYLYAGQDAKMFVITLLPLAFWALEAALEDGKLWRYLLFGGVYTLMVYSPHMQMAYFASWGIGAYFVFRIIRMLVKKRGIGVAGKHVGAFVLAVVLAIAISALQIYPPFKYLGNYSQRTQRTESQGYDWATSWSLHPEEMGSLVIPEFAGVNLGRINTYWGRNAFKINSDYFGIIVLILAIGAVVLLRKPRTWFFMGVGVFASIYALGAETPFFRLFYLLIPQVKKFRGPSMIIYLAAFSAVVLAAMVVEGLKNKDRRELLNRRGFKTFAIIVLGLFGLRALLCSVAGSGILKSYASLFYSGIDAQKKALMLQNLSNIVRGNWLALLVLRISLGALWANFKGKLRARTALILIILPAMFDLWRVDRPFVEIVDPDNHFRTTPSVEWLKDKYEEDYFRVLVAPRAFNDTYLASHGLEEVVFGVGHGNQLRTFDQFIGRTTGSRRLLSKPALGLLNIGYIAIRGQKMGSMPVAYSEGNLTIHSNPLMLPRAFPVYDWVTVDSPEKARQLVFSPDFPYDRKLAVEGEPPFSPTPITDSLYRPKSARKIPGDIEDFEVEVNMERDGLLFLSENWYPEWKAFENGEELPIYRADGSFRAVPLERGRHKVRFHFTGALFRKSLLVTLISMGAWIILFTASIVLTRRSAADG